MRIWIFWCVWTLVSDKLPHPTALIVNPLTDDCSFSSVLPGSDLCTQGRASSTSWSPNTITHTAHTLRHTCNLNLTGRSPWQWDTTPSMVSKSYTSLFKLLFFFSNENLKLIDADFSYTVNHPVTLQQSDDRFWATNWWFTFKYWTRYWSMCPLYYIFDEWASCVVCVKSISITKWILAFELGPSFVVFKA